MRHKASLIIHVGTYPPRECGIATFTEDLVNHIDEFLAPRVKSKIIALNESEVTDYVYSSKILTEINRNNEEEYRKAAEKVNSNPAVSLVSIQHEFGIFGGSEGKYISTFTDALKVPFVITFHTVLPHPNEPMKEIVVYLALKSARVIVMTELSKNILIEQYGLDPLKIAVIPHGIHPITYTPPQSSKKTLGLEKKMVLTTFGLLGPGKGIEYVIDSLPAVVKEFPNVLYQVLGVTHPVVLNRDGEAYRNSLRAKVKELGLTNNVKFHNSYFPLPRLLQFLKATDIYICPPQNPNQAVSGTFSYALGAGRPMISTSFSQAREYITSDVGLLVDFGSSVSFSHAILDLLRNPKLQLLLGKNAYFKTRTMTWPNVAIEYSKIFAEISENISFLSQKKVIPKVKLAHLFRMTDDFGIFQFARLTEPDPSSGYTLDDNARALLVSAMCLEWYKTTAASISSYTLKQLHTLSHVYVSFIEKCQKPDGTFINYFAENQKPHDILNQQENMDDANSRAIYALSVAATSPALPRTVKAKAKEILEKYLKAQITLHSPRAKATFIKSLATLASRKYKTTTIDLKEKIKQNCDELVDIYTRTHKPDWEWFEEHLTYSNALLPEALMWGSKILNKKEYFTIAKSTLEFLLQKSIVNNVYMPIGQGGWHYMGGLRTIFDQQPEDVTAMIQALDTIGKIEKDKKYEDLKHKVFAWFLGDNILQQVVYDKTTGGCYDGVRESQINLNQGAESTLSYLIARFLF